MNLEYAASLLNENFLLTEDADGEGVKGAKKWVTKHYHLTDFDKTVNDPATDDEGVVIRMQDRITHEERDQRVIDNIVETTRTFFGHWLGNNLHIPHNSNIGIYKFMPGAVRIAISDCGWFTSHSNKKMLDTLRYLYAAAFIEWRDAVDAGRQGKYNKDFNGLSFEQLNQELGSKIPEVKERFEEARTRNGAAAETGAEGEQQETAPAPVNNSPYHIELIENYRQSKTWFDYTNPTADDAGNHFAGARWCLCEYSDQWSYYQNHFDKKPTLYFCWKAESKAALKAMNEHVADYDVPEVSERDDEGNRNDKMNPFNEYGLSLICVMVAPGDAPGEVKFLQATSRYNHCNGHGEERFRGDVSTYYGDNLCREGGKRQICEILGMSREEFDRRLKPVNDVAGSSHENIMAAVNDTQAVLNAADNYDSVATFGLYKIRHNREYNFYDQYTHKFLSDQWFKEVYGFSPTGFAAVKYKNKYNIINTNGDYMIDIDVDWIDYDYVENPNYAKIGIYKNGDMYYNVVRVDTGRPLLRKLYKDVSVLGKFGKTISVLDDDNCWKLLDIKGKVITTFPQDTRIMRETSKLLLLGSNRRSNISRIVVKKNNKEIAKFSGPLNWINTYKDGCMVIKKDNKVNLFNENGPVFDSWVTEIDPYTYNDKVIYAYSNNREHGFVTSNGEKISCGTISRIDGIVETSDNKFYTMEGEEIDIPEDMRLIRSSRNVSILQTADNTYKFYNSKTKSFIDMGDNIITIYDERDYGYYIKTDDRKTNFINCSTGELISDEFFPGYDISYVGQDCYMLSKPGGENRLNIYNAEFGKELFNMDFTELNSRFSENGVALMTCYNSKFLINTNGDVSKNLTVIMENVRNYYGTENFLAETSNPMSNNHFFMNAAYLLD